MPTYEYVCEKCGHEFELIQSMVEKALSVCPKDQCRQKTWGKGKVKRKISLGGGVIFKGSGFYVNDYRSENYMAGAKKETESQRSATGGDKSASTDKGTAGAKSASGAKGAGSEKGTGGGTGNTNPTSESKKPAASPPKKKD
jgi:putative FmdB family regulatory protein